MEATCEAAEEVISTQLEKFAGDEKFDKLLSIFSQCAQSATIVGGAVRDLTLKPDDEPNDFDVMVDDVHLTLLLDTLQLWDFELETNRYGNWSFMAGPYSVDLFSPGRFFEDFVNIPSALCYFDLSVNAIGFNLHSEKLIDPVGGFRDLVTGSIRLMEPRWANARAKEQEGHPEHLWSLKKRLWKLLQRYPYFTVVNQEEILPEGLPTEPPQPALPVLDLTAFNKAFPEASESDDW